MFKSILLSLFMTSLILSPMAYAKKDKDNKGPNDMAYEKASDKSSFNRDADDDNKKSKEKKEKKQKNKGKKNK